MHPEIRAALFAQWLRAYVNKSFEQVTLNSDTYPLIQKAVNQHEEDLIASVDGVKYHLALAALNRHFHQGKKYERGVAQSRFVQALIYPDDPDRREAAKKAFLEYNSDETAWSALEAELETLAKDSSYIDQTARTCAHMTFIDTVCTDKYISLDEAITNPVILLQPAGATQPRLYQYDPRFLTHHKWTLSLKTEPKNVSDAATYTDGNIRFLPDLKEAMNKFYTELQQDLAATKEEIPDSIQSFAAKIPKLESTVVLNPTDEELVPQPSIPMQMQIQERQRRYQRHTSSRSRPTETHLCSLQGYILVNSPFVGLFFYGIGLLLSLEIPSFHYQEHSRNTNFSTINTDGQIFSAALGVTAFLLIIFAVARHQQYFNPLDENTPKRRIQTAGVAGLASGLFAALFTAKYLDGLTRPILQNGTRVDYAFTDVSSVYILVLSLATAALFYKAMSIREDRSVNRLMQFRREDHTQNLLSRHAVTQVGASV